MTHRLLIAYDPAHGDDSLVLGGVLAGVIEAAVEVVTVFRLPNGVTDSERLGEALEADSRAGFALARERLGHRSVKTRAVAGRTVAEALQRVAVEDGARLIVLGSHHGGDPGLLGLGDLAGSMLRGAPCAVAVAPRGYRAGEPPGLDRIAVAFDGSAQSWAALETGIGLAERVGGKLTILTIAEPPRYGYASAWSVLASGEIRDVEREEKERVLELGRARVPDQVRSDELLLTGHPGEVLAEASGEFDLIVAGSRGRGPLRRAALGSATRELLQSGQCPVIILPRALSVDPLGVRARGEGSVSGRTAPA